MNIVPGSEELPGTEGLFTTEGLLVVGQPFGVLTGVFFLNLADTGFFRLVAEGLQTGFHILYQTVLEGLEVLIDHELEIGHFVLHAGAVEGESAGQGFAGLVLIQDLAALNVAGAVAAFQAQSVRTPVPGGQTAGTEVLGQVDVVAVLVQFVVHALDTVTDEVMQGGIGQHGLNVGQGFLDVIGVS